MKAAASESFGYNEDPIVSSDVIGMKYGSLFDSTQTMVTEIGDGKYEVQVVSWYDNENSYTSQMVRTIKYLVLCRAWLSHAERASHTAVKSVVLKRHDKDPPTFGRGVFFVFKIHTASNTTLQTCICSGDLVHKLNATTKLL